MAWRAAITVLALAGLVLGLLWTFQRHLIYFPDTADAPRAASVLAGARDVPLRTADGLVLGAWFVPPVGPDRGLAVLLAPGNAGSRVDRAPFADALRRAGLAVLLMDYRGYGGNPGSPSEQGLAKDADAAVAALRDLGYSPDRTIYFGESLGTGVVASLQERHPPAGVVLRSPFTELAAVGTHHYRWLPVAPLLRDRFPVAAPMARSPVPTVVVYGDRDSIVPPALSAAVAESAGALAGVLVLPGADHNDAVMIGQEVAQAVAALADAVAPPGG
ncbi:MAG: alpha/beta hydrolase [Candidatus Nanopelagicales bacterium]|jgi:pimeloyl-ACP methyl ester carboxylesterase|nr:alpha/beta hydrolase [Candidatus Nanopelagicales bacterium]